LKGTMPVDSFIGPRSDSTYSYFEWLAGDCDIGE